MPKALDMIFTFHVWVDICGEDKMKKKKKKKKLEAKEAHFFQLTFNQAISQNKIYLKSLVLFC